MKAVMGNAVLIVNIILCVTTSGDLIVSEKRAEIKYG
jgi:hypothetical protein